MMTGHLPKKACDPSDFGFCELPDSPLRESSEHGLHESPDTRVQVVIRNRQRAVLIPDAWQMLVHDTVAQCLLDSAFPYPASVHVTFVGNRSIAELNRKFRNRKGITDVLSFPTLKYRMGKPVFSVGDIDPETGICFLGDVVICLARMREQATCYGHGEARELAFLAAHGVLHLLGHDHEIAEEERQMFLMQENVLSFLGLTRLGDDG